MVDSNFSASNNKPVNNVVHFESSDPCNDSSNDHESSKVTTEIAKKKKNMFQQGKGVCAVVQCCNGKGFMLCQEARLRWVALGHSGRCLEKSRRIDVGHLPN